MRSEGGGRVAGKVALVTGAARGIGRACALRLASEGADTALLDIVQSIETVPYAAAHSDQLEATASDIRGLGRRAFTLRADVRNGPAVRASIDEAIQHLGRIDILVTAAGIDSWNDAWNLTDEQWRTMIDVNLTGVWQSAKAVTPHMLARGSGAMVFIGSVLSHRPNKQFAHYTAAKHGVLGLMRSFALELAAHMIRVNAVDPTTVATDMTMNEPYMARAVGHANATIEEVKERNLLWNTMPVPWIEPIDVANAVLFLASDEARYITGVSLLVDLGAMLK
jgi:SDR family mycofactocin-dependent oxidoreductase